MPKRQLVSRSILSHWMVIERPPAAARAEHAFGEQNVEIRDLSARPHPAHRPSGRAGIARQPGADPGGKPPAMLVAMRQAGGNIGAEPRRIGVGEKHLLRGLHQPRARAVIIDRLDDRACDIRLAHAQQQPGARRGKVGTVDRRGRVDRRGKRAPQQDRAPARGERPARRAHDLGRILAAHAERVGRQPAGFGGQRANAAEQAPRPRRQVVFQRPGFDLFAVPAFLRIGRGGAGIGQRGRDRRRGRCRFGSRRRRRLSR
ncbi:hypothetical protein [Sphingopyxis sp. PET50]|uniref:hypothetical protein n=1 Tax=Sphingopyxis sp. PET50 TaxID=2976533 RepID=UPI0021AE8116|nr:hypothetical protein [Sphingopyxis sp. PET50]